MAPTPGKLMPRWRWRFLPDFFFRHGQIWETEELSIQDEEKKDVFNPSLNAGLISDLECI